MPVKMNIEILKIDFVFSCESGWTNNNCSQSLIRFPNEIDILKDVYYTSYGAVYNSKCGMIFNNVRIML